jgi:hypothetical protein
MPFVTSSRLPGAPTGRMWAASTSLSCILVTAHRSPYARRTCCRKFPRRESRLIVWIIRCRSGATTEISASVIGWSEDALTSSGRTLASLPYQRRSDALKAYVNSWSGRIPTEISSLVFLWKPRRPVGAAQPEPILQPLATKCQRSPS